MKENSTLGQIDRRARQAVTRYWGTRSAQQRKQEETGRADQGLRSAVTGGAQMDGFVDLFTDLIVDAGISKKYIFRKK
ncbi:restriction endonuclease, partial [Candidatus Bipolaricaulota bacterium]|nr:restriction endonuclease [Candidatus Bipolaricaulota bacterium]